MSNLKKLACASKQDVLDLATLRYLILKFGPPTNDVPRFRPCFGSGPDSAHWTTPLCCLIRGDMVQDEKQDRVWNAFALRGRSLTTLTKQGTL